MRTRPAAARQEPLLRAVSVVLESRLDIASIEAARGVIDPLFLDTPLYRCEALEPGLGCAVSIKLETANPVRSFKGRGTEVIASMLAERGARAVVCASAGNLGQALAWSGRGRGLDVTVVASRFAPAAKLDRIRALEARLELVDGDFDVARERAADIAGRDGIRLVEDSLDIETCEGAATIGLELTGRELVNTETSFDAVLIAPGGRCARYRPGHVVKARAPEVEVICIQPLGALHDDALVARTARRHHRLDQHHRRRRRRSASHPGRPGRPPAGCRRRRPGRGGVDHRRYVMLLDHAGLVVEPSAALGIAAILEDRDRFAGRHVVTIVCGSNVDVDAHRRWVGAAPAG